MTILVTTTEEPETTTTVAPPTTEPPTDADLIAEIEADLNENVQAFLTAGGDPGSAEAAAVIEEHYAGENRDARLRLFETLVESGLALRANPDLISRIEVLELLDSTPDSAIIRVCEIDAAVILCPPDDEFPEGVIVNDQISRYINEVTVRFDGGRWISTGGQSLDEAAIGNPSEATCDGF